MEGNACYKFSTVKNFIELSGQGPIKIVLDVGVNSGDITLMMHGYFPEASIYGFEAVEEYYRIALARTQEIAKIKLFNAAMSAQHLFADDLGAVRRSGAVELRLLKAKPEAGPGWGGGSVVLPADHELLSRARPPFGFERNTQLIPPVTLDEFMAAEKIDEIDLLKFDCEGCEHSVLGCADWQTLQRIRFIVGEYHELSRFYVVMKEKLFKTHKVNLVGQRDLGCFFAERLDGTRDGILRFDKTGMLLPRPWLCDTPIDWHLFNEKFVPEAERYWHAL